MTGPATASFTHASRKTFEQGVYSSDEEAPFKPTYFRMPGYPIFLAGVYSVFGHENNTAVRIVQAVFDTGTCVILGLIAFLWTEDDERKRRNALFAFLLASLCPFIVIYAATILSETLTTFLMAAMALTATLALKAASAKKSCIWWIVTGLLAGLAVFLRPDAGLFAGGIGLTIVISGLFFRREDPPKFFQRLYKSRGKRFRAFHLFFAWVIAIIVFGVFRPISPATARCRVVSPVTNWLRTGGRFSLYRSDTLESRRRSHHRNRGGMLIPGRADASRPLDRTTIRPGENQNPPPAADEDNSADNEDRPTTITMIPLTMPIRATISRTQYDNSTMNRATMTRTEIRRQMTPKIDAGFAAIADERIARSPGSLLPFLPANVQPPWFDSHSLYYPFGGQMSPIGVDYDVDGGITPAFTSDVDHTCPSGGCFCMKSGEQKLLQWLTLAADDHSSSCVLFDGRESRTALRH